MISLLKIISEIKTTSLLYIDNSNIHGKGLFISKPILKNTKIQKIADFSQYKNNPDNVLNKYGEMINHSLTPNINVDKNGYLYSLRNIKANEELTANYKNLIQPYFDINTNFELEELKINNPTKFNLLVDDFDNPEDELPWVDFNKVERLLKELKINKPAFKFKSNYQLKDFLEKNPTIKEEIIKKSIKKVAENEDNWDYVEKGWMRQPIEQYTEFNHDDDLMIDDEEDDRLYISIDFKKGWVESTFPLWNDSIQIPGNTLYIAYY